MATDELKIEKTNVLLVDPPQFTSRLCVAFFHLWNIACLHPFLNINDAETLYFPPIDYCNSLFFMLTH